MTMRDSSAPQTQPSPAPDPHATADAIVLPQRRTWASSFFVLLLVVFLPGRARGLV
jgi:hypothetical protein